MLGGQGIEGGSPQQLLLNFKVFETHSQHSFPSPWKMAACEIRSKHGL